MKAQIAAKYIQFLSNKKANKNSGFTLIELLVVIIIIGILSAIALPSFLNQAAKARASEARTNIGSMNGGQQAYYLQAQKFAIDEPNDSGIKKMGIGIKETTTNYAYTSATGAAGAANEVYSLGAALNKDLKSHIGAAFSVNGVQPTILCQAKIPNLEVTLPTDKPTTTPAGVLTCGANTDPVGG